MSDTTNFNDAGSVVSLLDRAGETMRGSRYRRGSAVRLPGRGRLVATGDLHDNPYHLEKIVALARLEQDPNHHVVLHEMIHGERLINGMDFSHRMLLRVAALIVDHPDQVHAVLANHELAQMTGRGVSKGAGNSVTLFNDAIEFVFGDESQEVSEAVNRFIRAMPVAVLSEGGVLCAHSLPGERVMDRFDPDLLDRGLLDDDYAAPHGSAYLMVWGRRYGEEQVDALADRWGVELFCLGHEHAETGIETRGRRVVVLNSDHERAAVLPLELARLPAIEEVVLHAVPLGSVGGAGAR